MENSETSLGALLKQAGRVRRRTPRVTGVDVQGEAKQRGRKTLLSHPIYQNAKMGSRSSGGRMRGTEKRRVGKVVKRRKKQKDGGGGTIYITFTNRGGRLFVNFQWGERTIEKGN